jgi:glycosyltransferase involved in cell wall biosynthesis
MVCGIMVDKRPEIPVCVLVMTKNEERHIARCLDSISGFSYVGIVDSHSTDRTPAIAREKGAHIMTYKWDGRYPKKRQWCLDMLALPHDWVLWLDADEELMPELITKIRALFQKGEPSKCGYFIRGQYVLHGKALQYGLHNNKIALMNRRKMKFPVVDDLDIEGMGEIEGHYQPVLREGISGSIGQIRPPMLHHAYEDRDAWLARHKRYASWEAGMIRKKSEVEDPVVWRAMAKRVLRAPVLRGIAMFLYSYILRLGFLDGKAGFDFAQSRLAYYFLVRKALKKT